MARSFSLFLSLLAASACSAVADQTAQIEDALPAPVTRVHASYEIETDYGYVSDSRTNLEHGRTGNLAEQSSSTRLLIEPRWGDGPIYRFGLGLQRYSFGLPRMASLPNTLQSLTAIVGVDLQVGNSWLVRIEAEPGFYNNSSDVRGSDFNAPFIIGGSYIASANLQWVLGLSVDVNRRYPVFPAIGVRWTFMDSWTLNAVLPSPRIEYAWQKNLNFFAGADLKDGTFRVSDDFGNSPENKRLNHSMVEYDEIRIGGGLSWKALPACTVEIEGGYLPYRDFDFHRAHQSFKTDSGAAYGQMAVSAKF